MLHTTRKFLLDLVERAGKSFAQGYFATWALIAGIGDDMNAADNGAFDSLFTLNNLKGGVVMAALSFFTSILSKPVGSDASASLIE